MLSTTARLGQAVVIWFDPATRAAWCSDTAQEILGLEPQRLAACWAGDLALVRESDRAAVQRMRDGAGSGALQFQIRRGNDTWAEAEGVFSPADDGSDAVIAVIRDISSIVLREEDSAVFDRLSGEARFINCRRTNTVRFGPAMKEVYGIDLRGTYPVPSAYVDHIHPEDNESAYHGFFDLIETTDSTAELQYRLRRGDGSYAYVRERILVQRDETGTVERVYSTVTDITDWQEERKRRALLARVSGRVVIDYDPRDDRMQISGATMERLGYAPEDMPRTHRAYLDMLHPDDRPVLAQAIDALHAGKVWSEPLELSYRLRRADGSYAQFLDRSLTVIGADGRAEGVIVSLTDVSNLLRQEEELRESHARLALLAELSEQVVAELDIASGKVIWSGAVREQFGFAPEEMPETPPAVFDMMHPDDRIAHEQAFEGLARGEVWTRPLELSFRTRHKDGRQLHIMNRSVCILDKDGQATSVLVLLNDVTSLLRQRDQLLAITEIASDAAYEYYHNEGRIVFNQGFETSFGLPIVGEHTLPMDYDFVHPEDLEVQEARFIAFVESDRARFTSEYRLRRGDGSWANIFESVAALRDEDGRPTLIVGTLEDVTEQRRTERRLREAVEALDSGFALYNEAQELVLHNRRFVEMNPGVADLIKPGARRDDLLAALIARNQLLVPARAKHSQTSDGLQPVNAQVTQANGLIYNLRFNPTASGDWVSLLTDITHVVQDQQKLRAMFDVSVDAMFDYEVTAGEITFDSGFKTNFGYDWGGRHKVPSVWETVLHPDDLPRVTAEREAFIASRRARFDTEFRMQRADGSWAYVSERAVVLRDETGRAITILGAVADLTEQRLMEAKLLAAQKMEAIGRISGGIAHDFNNLLAVIMGNAELLVAADAPPETRQSAEDIIDAAARGAELTRRLLSFARQSHLAPARVDPNALVSGMGQIIARVLPETITQETSLQAGIWQTKVDRAFLESALLNLVINARDAMPKGGILTIETANRRVTEDYVVERSEYIVPGRYVMIAVTDTGEGIAPEMLEKVIEPFFTTKGPNLGSGLGLSMVDGFVRQSGGVLRIYSEPGIGTTVRMLLLADPDDARAGLTTGRDSQAVALENTPSVLLAEDEPRVRAIIARALRDAGLQVVEAASGDAALAAYQEMPQPPDILLTDVVMPGQLQGPMLARKLKEMQPGLQIIFMSGYANDAAINGNGLRPDDVFLMKPVQRQTLMETIARLVRTGN